MTLRRSKAKKTAKLTIEQKYELYENSVQNPKGDITFINKEFSRYFKKKPLSLREDFGGTGKLATLWTKQSDAHVAHSVDLDHEPMNYGLAHHYAKLTASQKRRMHYHAANVLDSFPFKVDVVVALNFSYFIFKERQLLLRYFKQVHKGLGAKGMFFIDVFGGAGKLEPFEDRTAFDDFTYYWNCARYNPINNECLYYIHYKKGARKHERVFEYDWRMWTIRELREILAEAGFENSVAYWEGFDKNGDGDGKFVPSEVEENCEGWVAYIVATKG